MASGSYKFFTQIRPVRKDEEFDIDLGVYFQWNGNCSAGQHSAQTLRSFVQDSLNAFYDNNPEEEIKEVCPQKERCCRIRYLNNFHIDIPTYHLDVSKDARTLATSSKWEPSDPKAVYVWFRDQFQEPVRARVRRHVKYLKAWAALKFKDIRQRPSSIMLTVSVVEAALALEGDVASADDEAFRDLIIKIADRLTKNRIVACPVNSTEDLNRLPEPEFLAFRSKLTELQNVAERATAAATEAEAADLWQEAFDYMFPMPDPEEILAKDSQNLPALSFMPEIKVTATSTTNRNVRPFSGINAIGPIPKDCDIRFEIINAAAAPANTKFYWTVRNEGREAELVNDLGHPRGTGLIAEESSVYKGTHYMDCVAKVGGQTIAIRRVPVTITGFSMPLRNPPRKLRP